MQSREHKFTGPSPQYPLGLPSNLAVLPVEDIVSSIGPDIQNRYIEHIIRYQARVDRVQHVQRRRPRIYLDFDKNKILCRGVPARHLPATLAIRTLQHLFRRSSIGVVQFHLLPRTKRPLGSVKQGNLTRAFATEKCRLDHFIAENNLPLRIRHSRGTDCLKLGVCYVRSNIHDALELAESAQHRMELSDHESAAILANRALIIDPDCGLAAIVIADLVRQHLAKYFREPAIRAQNCFTRELLAYASNIGRIDPNRRDDATAQEIIGEARRRISVLTRRLQPIWTWLTRPEDADIYPKVLQLIAQTAIAEVRPAGLSRDDAFQQLINVPEVREAIYGLSYDLSEKNAAKVFDELQVRFWRLLFFDGWLSTSIKIGDFVNAIRTALKSRLRASNTPDGAARIPGAEYRDDWYEDKEEDAES